MNAFSICCRLVLLKITAVVISSETRESRNSSYTAASSGPRRCCKSDRKASFFCSLLSGSWTHAASAIPAGPQQRYCAPRLYHSVRCQCGPDAHIHCRVGRSNAESESVYLRPAAGWAFQPLLSDWQLDLQLTKTALVTGWHRVRTSLALRICTFQVIHVYVHTAEICYAVHRSGVRACRSGVC